MWIRARFDIAWSDLVAAATYCILPMARSTAKQRTEQAWDSEGHAIATLSVRSAFDLMLRALQLPAGSEVLLSALTVPDMVKIVREHGLRPIPVDVDVSGMILVDSLEAAISERSRLLIVAHLFGGMCDMEMVHALTQRHDLIVVEDCAQSFTSVGVQGHPKSDFVMHSFGPIKTATAAGGGIVKVASKSTLNRMRQILAADPTQSRPSFFMRLLRIGVLKFFSGFYMCGVLIWIMKLIRLDVDVSLNSMGRGFGNDELLTQLRLQPSAPLQRLMLRRWTTYDFDRINRRRELGRRLDALLSKHRLENHSYWVYPLFLPSAKQLCERLQSRGYDAACRSRMVVVPPPESSAIAENASRNWSNVIFLPWYAELTEQAIDEMGQIVRSHVAGD